MTSIGDIYEVVDTQRIESQEVLNVYFFRVQSMSVTDNNAESVVQAFLDTYIPAIVPIQRPLLVHTSVRARNLFDETDAHEELISSSGTYASGEVLPIFDTIPFRLVGDNAAVRAGAKRYAGATETMVTDGVITDATVSAALDALASVLFADLPWGLLAAEILKPVIVKRILDAGNYRLPENSGEAVYSNILDALWTPLISSQVSRKVGRGV